MVLRGSDICDPHYSWSSTSISRCIHISLLRLQEILLAKLVTTGVVIPGIALIRYHLPAESGSVVGHFCSLYGLCNGELWASAIDDAHGASCLLGGRIGGQNSLGSGTLEGIACPECRSTSSEDDKATDNDGTCDISCWRSTRIGNGWCLHLYVHPSKWH